MDIEVKDKARKRLAGDPRLTLDKIRRRSNTGVAFIKPRPFMSLTNADIQNIAQTVEHVTGARFDRIEDRLGTLEESQNRLTTSVDHMLAIVRRHEEEWLVLRAQHAKIRDLLLKKGIATEDELAVA